MGFDAEDVPKPQPEVPALDDTNLWYEEVAGTSKKPGGSPNLMRLALKVEPAGKNRVFTIVDSFTQRLCLPLHEWVCDVLRRIPMDETFDQLRPARKVKGMHIWSFDLTSATDRMPIGMSVSVLEALFGSEFALSWMLLMQRPLSSGKMRWSGRSPMWPLHFARGTPLGALSAWPVFALMHHLLVQFAAERAGLRGKVFTSHRWRRREISP